MGIFDCYDEVIELKNRLDILECKFKHLHRTVECNKYKDIYDFINKQPEMKHFIFNTGDDTQDVIYGLLNKTFNELTTRYTDSYGYISYYVGDAPVCLSKVIEDLEVMRTKLKEAKQND